MTAASFCKGRFQATVDVQIWGTNVHEIMLLLCETILSFHKKRCFRNLGILVTISWRSFLPLYGQGLENFLHLLMRVTPPVGQLLGGSSQDLSIRSHPHLQAMEFGHLEGGPTTRSLGDNKKTHGYQPHIQVMGWSFRSFERVKHVESPTRGWEKITNNELNTKWIYLEVLRRSGYKKNNKLNIEKQQKPWNDHSNYTSFT